MKDLVHTFAKEADTHGVDQKLERRAFIDINLTAEEMSFLIHGSACFATWAPINPRSPAQEQMGRPR
jgi:hypothetical protein